MQTAWLFDTLALTVEDIDFLDPAIATSPGARERGVRLEVRPLDTTSSGTVYRSPAMTLAPSVCRVDLLESEPGAADRMHWHPVMSDGEPGERVFDAALSGAPLAWLADLLADILPVLTRAHVPPVPGHATDASRIADEAPFVISRVEAGLAQARQPWPAVQHDQRGLAEVRSDRPG